MDIALRPCRASNQATEGSTRRVHTNTGALVRRFSTTRAGAALVLANLRYWPTIARHVRSQLVRWESVARAIPDRQLREMALRKLQEERFNAELAATLATLAPRSRRATTTEAIVALQVLYDYLDIVNEHHALEPLDVGARLFEALTDALRPGGTPSENYYPALVQATDGGYLQALIGEIRGALARLPATQAVRGVALASAARCSQAQIRNHAAPDLGTTQLKRWAVSAADGTGLQWQEFLAGAGASVLAIHALVAAAADDRTTRADALQIDALYLQIGALTMLDSVVDQVHDASADQPGYLHYYDGDEELLIRRLLDVVGRVVDQARFVANGPHHVMTLTGIVAYYTSAATVRGEEHQVTARLCDQLRPLITPTLTLMRIWRAAKRLAQRRGNTASMHATACYSTSEG